MKLKIGKAGLLGVVVCSMFADLLLPSLARDTTVSEAASAISYRMIKGDKVKLTTITSQSKLSAAKKKKVTALFWKSKNKKIVKISQKKILAVKAGTAKLIGYTKKKKGKKSITIRVRVLAKPKLSRRTTKGSVKGLRSASGTAMTWYGVPYAASTAGANRWKAPQPVAAWRGTRNATVVPQKAAAYSASSASGYAGTEDCLYVNVYRPYTPDKNLPVLVYLHGGGNTSGTANVGFENMAAAMGVVIVSVSFRVGAFGYFSHPALMDGTEEENSGNFTLLDIREALRWVRNEIAVFGGNPWNVTLSGFSSGARNALMCLIAPSMRGLFQKAFIMSGGYTTSTPTEGQKSVESRLAALLVKRGTYKTEEEALSFFQKATKAEMKKLLTGLTTAEVAWLYKNADLKLESFPQGFTDGVVLPEEGFAVIKKGNYNRVPIMLGSDATEFSSFAMDGSLTASEADLSSLSSTQMMELMEKGIQYGSMLQSCFYIENTVNTLYQDAGHRELYAYRLCWGTTASISDGFYSKYVGAYHGQSRDFLLGDYKHRMKEYSPEAVSSKNKKGRVALTEQMRSYLKNFMVNGNPNGVSLPQWNTWNPTPGVGKIMYFDAKRKKVSSVLSAKRYDADAILGDVRNHTTKEEYTALTKSLWEGRFFLPSGVLQ